MSLLLAEVAIEAKSPADRERLFTILEMLAAVDDSLGVASDRETGQIVLRGRDEFCLERAIDRITRDHSIALNLGGPQVFYRETPGRRSEIDYTHKDQSGWDQFARVKLVFEPGEPGSGYSFESKIVGGAVPKEFIPGVERALEASRESGVLAGFPVIDFKAMLVDGAYHDVDSSVLAFEIAARAAFKEGLQKAQCKLLEPIMKVRIAVPLEFTDEIVRDLDQRRAYDRRLERRRTFQIIHALVPLANMFGYTNSLRSIMQRRAVYAMTFAHYAPVPFPPDDDPFRPAVAVRA